MTDEEQVQALANQLKREPSTGPAVAALLHRCRDVLDNIACGIKGEYSEKDTTLNPIYHLEATVTVQDARDVEAVLKSLDKVFRKAIRSDR